MAATAQKNQTVASFAGRLSTSNGSPSAPKQTAGNQKDSFVAVLLKALSGFTV